MSCANSIFIIDPHEDQVDFFLTDSGTEGQICVGKRIYKWLYQSVDTMYRSTEMEDASSPKIAITLLSVRNLTAIHNM